MVNIFVSSVLMSLGGFIYWSQALVDGLSTQKFSFFLLKNNNLVDTLLVNGAFLRRRSM